MHSLLLLPLDHLASLPNWYNYLGPVPASSSSPRKTLKDDFGLAIADDVEIHVWDSSAEIRYFVIPERPLGTERMSEDELTKTREPGIHDRCRHDKFL